MSKNNYFGRFLSFKHAQPSSASEQEVVVTSKLSHNAWQNHINRISTISLVIYTKFKKKHRSRDNVKESLFWTQIGNSARTFVIMH